MRYFAVMALALNGCSGDEPHACNLASCVGDEIEIALVDEAGAPAAARGVTTFAYGEYEFDCSQAYDEANPSS